MRSKIVLLVSVVLLSLNLFGCGGGPGSTPPPPPPPPVVQVSVSPASASVETGKTQQFVATVTGTTNTAVTWSVTGSGSISASGLYTAPNASGSATVTATSAQDLAKSASATVTVTMPPAPTCSLSASPGAILTGQSATLSWSSSNASSASVDQGVGSVPLPSGAQSITPAATATYTMSVSGAGGSTTCQATVTVNTPALADFSVNASSSTVSLPASGAASVTVSANATSSGSTAYAVDLALGTLPQGVTASFGQASLAPAQSTTLTLAAAKDAPAVSSFSVTITGTRVSDNTIRSASVSLDVTRIALGGGDITYVPDNTNGLFSPSSQQCFADFASFMASLRNTLFGAPDTQNLTVNVKINPLIGGGRFAPVADTMELGQAPACQDPNMLNVLGIMAHEDTHAAHRSWLRLMTQTSSLQTYREEGGANAAAVLESVWGRAQTPAWFAGIGHEDAPLDMHLLNRLSPELIASAEEFGHADPAANSLWMHAATALHLQAIFAGSSGPSGDISQWNSMLKRWNGERYAFVNREQRLPTSTEDDGLFTSAASPSPIDGLTPSAWLAGQVITTPLTSLRNNRTFVGLLFRSSVNPRYVDVPIAIRDAAGNETTATSGSATFSVFAADGSNACRDETLDLAQVHEYAFVCRDTAGNVVQLAEGVYQGTVDAAIGGQNYTASNYFVIAAANGKTASGWPGIYVITRDASGNITDATVTSPNGSAVKRIGAGLFLLTPPDTSQLPMEVTLTATTPSAMVNAAFTVPPLRWWTTVGIVDIK